MKLIDRDELVRILNKRREFYCDNTPDSFSKLSYPDKCRVDMLDTCISDTFNIPSKSFDSVIEDIKVDIYKSCCFNEGTQFAKGLLTAIRIIDKHIIGKEDTNEDRTN